jgi:hypothetical protein
VPCEKCGTPTFGRRCAACMGERADAAARAPTAPLAGPTGCAGDVVRGAPRPDARDILIADLYDIARRAEGVDDRNGALARAAAHLAALLGPVRPRRGERDAGGYLNGPDGPPGPRP